MATSGSIDFTLTARGLITFALRKLQVVGTQGVANINDLNRANVELNMMLKEWQVYHSLWRATEGSFPLVADTAAFTLSPEPHQVIDARYDTQDTETPMFELSRQEYYDLPLKTNQGTPTQFYVDRQRASVVMYVWPVIATVDDETINYTYFRKFEDIDDYDNDLDIRTEWLSTVGYNLAARLLVDFGKEGETAARLSKRAEKLLEILQDDDREGTIRFVAGDMY